MAENTDKKNKEVSAIKLLNFTVYIEIILAQEDRVCFQIVEVAKTKDNKYREARLAWTKLSRKFEPRARASKTRLYKKFSKCKLDYITRNPE